MRLRMFPLTADQGTDSTSATDDSKKSQAVIPVNPSDDDDESCLLASTQDVAEFAVFLFYPLRRWALGVTLMYAFCLFLVGLFIALQEYTTNTVHDNHNLRTSLTQTASVWVSVNSFPGGIKTPVFNGVSLSNTCPYFSGVNYTNSNSYIQPITVFYSNLDARVLVLLIFIITFFSHLMIVFRADSYHAPFRAGNGHIGVYLERTMTVPLVILTLCTQAGLTDLWVLLSLTINAWGAMLFSFLAEVLFQGDGGFLDVTFSKVFKNSNTPDTNKGGGARFYNDGVAHYHAIALFAAWGQLAMAVLGLFSNGRIAAACISPSQTLPSNIATAMITISILYGLNLLGQTFSAILKLKPSAVKYYYQESKKESNTEKQKNEAKLEFNNGRSDRMYNAVRLEIYYLWVDFTIKIILFFSVFVNGTIMT